MKYTLKSLNTMAATLIVFSSVAGSANAAVIFFVNDSSGFNTAVNSLMFEGTEDWEQSTLAANNIAFVADPLTPGVANGAFPTGSNSATGIIAQSNMSGASSAVLNPRGTQGLSTASAGYFGTPSDQVSADANGDSFDLIFSMFGNPTGGVSLNPLYFDTQNATSSTSNPGSVLITVYDTNNVFLGTQTVNGVDYSASIFLGVVGTDGSTIGRINLFGLTNPTISTAGADNISVYSVPEPSSAALILAGAGILSMYRKRSRCSSL